MISVRSAKESRISINHMPFYFGTVTAALTARCSLYTRINLLGYSYQFGVGRNHNTTGVITPNIRAYHSTYRNFSLMHTFPVINSASPISGYVSFPPHGAAYLKLKNLTSSARLNYNVEAGSVLEVELQCSGSGYSYPGFTVWVAYREA